MKSIFMRVLFCKIHCPSFICFCKPSAAAHLYTSGPLKLDNTPHVLPLRVEEPLTHFTTSCYQLTGETIEVKDERSCLDDEKLEKASEINALKSCIRHKEEAASESGEVENKKVQWVDTIGKEIAHIKEFESSETWDSDSDEDNRGCLCVIL